MARVNIPLTIHQPGFKELVKPTFVANADGNTNVIPFRYPFADIKNYADLKARGFFRHATTTVSTELGGSATTNTASNMGFALPRTEKLILLCKVGSALTADKNIVITISGSTEYGVVEQTYKIAEDNVNQDTDGVLVAAGDILEIDLFDFGLYIDGGEITITADGSAAANADDAKIAFALVARTA